MKKISKRLLKANMDNLFLSYCYRVAQLTTDYKQEEYETTTDPDLPQEDKDSYIATLREEFNGKVQAVSGKFHKAIGLWAMLYAGKDITADGDIIH